MRRSLIHLTFLAAVALSAFSTQALAQFPLSPGFPIPPNSVASDNKPGSILVYNVFTSSPGSPNNADTRFSMTNVHPSLSAFVHLFFIDGRTCAVADTSLCFTPNQTTTFLASDADPGVTGYLIAVAVDGITGCPVNFNYLEGSEFVRFTSGHHGNINAVAFAALLDPPTTCVAGDTRATIIFEGVHYNTVPILLGLDNFPSPVDGNNGIVVVNRIGGQLQVSAGFIFGINGALFGDREDLHSFVLTPATCQLIFSIASLNVVPGGVAGIVPAGHSGWIKFSSIFSSVGITGATFNLNNNAGNPLHPGNFSGGRNLQSLTIGGDVLTIPVFTPSC